MSVTKDDKITVENGFDNIAADGVILSAGGSNIEPFKVFFRACTLFFARFVEIPCLVWAFTESNFITFVLPNTAFGVLSALAGQHLLQVDTNVDRLTSNTILWRTLLSATFNWANVLVFDRRFLCQKIIQTRIVVVFG